MERHFHNPVFASWDAKEQGLCQIDLDLDSISFLPYQAEENGYKHPSLSVLQALNVDRLCSPNSVIYEVGIELFGGSPWLLAIVTVTCADGYWPSADALVGSGC